jgi:hypothetical protein
VKLRFTLTKSATKSARPIAKPAAMQGRASFIRQLLQMLQPDLQQIKLRVLKQQLQLKINLFKNFLISPPYSSLYP